MKTSLIILIAATLASSGCKRQNDAESAAQSNQSPPVSEQANSNAATYPVIESSDHPLYGNPAVAQQFASNRNTSDLIQFSESPSVPEKEVMESRMVQFLDQNVPEFVIKLDATPWLDVRYTPLSVSIVADETGESPAMANVLFQRDLWDDGEKKDPEQVSIQMLWLNGVWVPDDQDPNAKRLLQELADASSTLRKKWAPGERPE